MRQDPLVPPEGATATLMVFDTNDFE